MIVPPSMIRIAIAAPEEDGCRVAAFDGAVVIGREQRCDLTLTTRGVSSSHCRVSPMPGLAGAYMVEDLGSTYGTYVNGARVGKPVVVSERDVVTVGSVRLVVVGPAGDAAALQRLSAAEAPPEPPSSTPSAAAQRPPPQTLADVDAQAPWPQQFARIDSLAREWHEAGRPKGALLKGPSIRIGERLLEAGRRRDPAPEALHQEFVVASRRATSSRMRTVIVVVLALAVAGAAVAAWRVFDPDIAALWRDPDPILDDDAAEVVDATEGEVTEPVPPHDITDLTDRSLAVVEPSTRLLLQAGIAGSARTYNEPLLDGGGWALHGAVQQTLADMRETILAGHESAVLSVGFGPRGRYIVSGSADASARLWDLSLPAPTVPSKLRGHLGPVNAAGITPDGRFVVTAGDDTTVRRWDLTASDPGATGVVLRKHKAAVTHLALHPTGRFAVTGDENGTLVAWDLEAADPTATAHAEPAHTAVITDLVFDHAASPSLYSASDDRLARRWRVGASGLRKAGKLSAHLGGVTSVAVSQDARFVATGGTDGEVYLWDLRPKSEGKVALLGHKESVNDLAFTPDSKLLVTGSDDDTLRVWEVLAKDPSLASVSFSGHTGDITTVRIAAGGKKAVTAGLDNTIRVWDLLKKDRVVEQSILDGHGGHVRGLDISPDGLTIATGSEDATVRVWDALSNSGGRGGKILRLSATQVFELAVTPLGDQLVAVGAEGGAALWDLRDDARRPRPRVLPGLKGLVNTAALDSSGQLLATAGEDGEIQVWPITEADPSARKTVLTGHEGPVNALAFTPRSGRLLSVSSDRTVRVWSLSGGAEPIVWTQHADEVHELVIAPRGNYAVTGGLGPAAVRWDLRAEAFGSAVKLGGHKGQILDLEVSPDGKHLVTTSADRRARVWDLSAGKLLHELRDHDEAVTSAAWGSRGLIATAGGDAKIFVWDLASDDPSDSQRALAGHEQTVTELAFTPDGAVLVSASNDSTLRMWRLDTGDSIVLKGHDKVVNHARVTGDGRFVVSSSFDGTVRLWPLDYDRLAWLACDVIGAPLSPAMWTKVFGPPVPPPTCTGE